MGTLSIQVTADDGNGGSIADTFDIVVANTNDAPTVANTIPDRSATQGAAFNFQFAANTFADADVGDTLTYSAQVAGGGGSASLAGLRYRHPHLQRHPRQRRRRNAEHRRDRQRR